VSVAVAVLDDYQDLAREYGPWERLGERVTLTTFTDHLASDAELAARLAPFEVVVAMRERTPFTAERLRALPALRLLVTTGMANASIDLAAARELDIAVAGTGGMTSSTVELTWALILALARHVCAEDAVVRTGGWQHTIGPELDGRTLGVMGLGRLGSRVAAIGQAFGMNVIAWSENLRAEDAAQLGVHAVSKHELLAGADVLTIHLRLSDRTRGLVAAAELEQMKPSALLINTSRGPIVDEAALLAALAAGTIAGAGLDVYDVEPLPPEHPLRSAPNTVLTPHIGYVSEGCYRGFFEEIVQDIEAWLDERPLRVLN
jgi:phosphoglycerate dehydrogenase-like enzyme